MSALDMDAFLANLADDVAAKVAERLAVTLPAPDRLLTVEQAADRLGVSERTVRNLTSKGTLAMVKVEGATRISNEDLESYVASRRVTR